MFFLSLIVTAVASPPSADVLQAAWTRHSDRVERDANHPIRLNRSDFETVASGRVAKRRIVEQGPDRAMGLLWAPVDRNTLWIAVLDDIHDTVVQSLTEHRLANSPEGRKRLYQRLDLPWPFNDRQWVIEIWNNQGLVQSTHGAVWERSWDLTSPELMPQPDPQALWVPMTNGSWLLVDAAGGTLMAYSARTTIGGAIPDEAVTRWAMATLDEMMMHIVERSKSIPDHYGPEHEPVLDGANAPIPPFELTGIK